MIKKIVFVLLALLLVACEEGAKPELKFDDEVSTIEYGSSCDTLLATVKDAIVWGNFESVQLGKESCTGEGIRKIGKNEIEVIATLANRSKSFSLNIDVVDTQLPVFIKTSSEIEIAEGDSFNLRDYYLGVDPVDGELEAFLTSDLPNPLLPGDYSREVHIEDNNGNKVTHILQLKVKTKIVETPNTQEEGQASGQVNETIPPVNNSNSQETPSLSVEPSSLNKQFLFTNGYDMNTAYEACSNYILDIRNKYNFAGACLVISEGSTKKGYQASISK